MDTLNLPTWLQSGSYPARLERIFLDGFFGAHGVVTQESFVTTAQATPNMSLRLTGGQAFIRGTANSYNTKAPGLYNVNSDGFDNVEIPPADSYSRKDLIILRVYDSEYIQYGTQNLATFEVIKGYNTDVPPTPAFAIPIAVVAVGPGVSAITNANIQDVRPFAIFSDAITSLQVTKPVWKPLTSFASGIGGFGGGYQPPKYRVNGSMVEFSGMLVTTVQRTGLGQWAIFTMPDECRPQSVHIMPASIGKLTAQTPVGAGHYHNIYIAGMNVRLDAHPNGQMYMTFESTQYNTVGEYISLSNVFFDKTTPGG